ncbi:hypothetical protein [Ruminiclostridium cellobioparum]|uniref:Uncharacterized protein n=1 Tax=Ruminiclostridium cellobioparum subsp. termitidis CT1112 TaxID=1195236 RepID=S0FPC1_RUMCE|nr:hypothetical protein [Ruminiclostridium cellobioparum]EMS70303.1 hypothetical protein CTER_3951 [Ruminiclostridium cellobioparum subsp. termitidis CT1112]
MISSDRAVTAEPIIDIKILKDKFPQYYRCLGQDELQPHKIVLCSNLIANKDELLEKLIMIYSTKLVIIKIINGSISKMNLGFEDINYVVNEGQPNSYCISIDYRNGLKERIFFDSNVNELVNGLLVELRKKLIENTFITEKLDYSDIAFSDTEENIYTGALLAKNAVIDKASVLCSLKQKKVYHHPGLLFNKVMTHAHFTIVCKQEIIIFMENDNSRPNHNITGDLIHIPLRALKNIALEATGKGMKMKYVFNTDKKMEIFYENERTDQLLKIMSYINSMIVRQIE